MVFLLEEFASNKLLAYTVFYITVIALPSNEKSDLLLCKNCKITTNACICIPYKILYITHAIKLDSVILLLAYNCYVCNCLNCSL